jgi:MurNAc alpha-1-phosphate uridylyltransferase
VNRPPAAGIVRTAMVLAAGRGVRLRPITEDRPKPLVTVAGRAILDRTLDALAAAGVDACVVNTHHLGRMIAAHVARRGRPAVRISPEPRLLDTGGGVLKARPFLGDGPFFVVTGDVLWDEGPEGPALARLAAGFDPVRMDALLLVVARERAVGYDGPGDFTLGGDGRLHRRGAAPAASHVFTGLQVLNPALLAGCPEGAFSLNLLYDRAITARRLHGLAHAGRWYHVGTLDGLDRAEAALGAGGDGAPGARGRGP